MSYKCINCLKEGGEEEFVMCNTICNDCYSVCSSCGGYVVKGEKHCIDCLRKVPDLFKCNDCEEENIPKAHLGMVLPNDVEFICDECIFDWHRENDDNGPDAGPDYYNSPDALDLF